MIAIINPGTQPELKYVALALQERGLEFKYFTSSSFGNDYFANKNYKFIQFSKLIRTFAQRRSLPIADKNVRRFLLFSSILIRILPRRMRNKFLNIRNIVFRLIMFIRLSRSDFSHVIIQDFCPIYWKFLKSRFKIIVVLSNASPNYVKDIMIRECLYNENAKEYFGRDLPKIREIFGFEKSMQLADQIIVPSNFVRNSFRFESLNSLIPKIRVVRLGFSPNLFLPDEKSKLMRKQSCESESFNVIFVGQICWRKGVHYLVQAFADANLPIGSTLTLVGVSINGYAEELISKNNFIIYKKFVNQWELRYLLAEAHLYVMPSLIEGFCLSAIESMAFGIPVLVTPETIDGIEVDCKDGLSVRSCNSTEIREKLEWANQNRLKLLEIGHLGSLKARKYTWHNYGNRFCESLELDKFTLE